MYNVAILGFENGFDVDQQETAARVQIRNSYVFGQEEGMFESDDGAESDPPIDEEALWNTDGWGNVAGVDPLLVDPFNLGMPDFRPAAGSPLTDDYAEPPAGSDFFDAVDYIGAFAPGMPQRIEGWTTQDQG